MVKKNTLKKLGGREGFVKEEQRTRQYEEDINMG